MRPAAQNQPWLQMQSSGWARWTPGAAAVAVILGGSFAVGMLGAGRPSYALPAGLAAAALTMVFFPLIVSALYPAVWFHPPSGTIRAGRRTYAVRQVHTVKLKTYQDRRIYLDTGAGRIRILVSKWPLPWGKGLSPENVAALRLALLQMDAVKSQSPHSRWPVEVVAQIDKWFTGAWPEHSPPPAPPGDLYRR